MSGRNNVLRLLAVLLIMSLIAACSGNGGGSQAGPEPSSAPNPAPSSESPGSAPPADPVELSVFSWMFEGADNPDSPIYQKLQEKLNIRLKPVTASWNDWEEKLNVLIASGEMPDVFISYGVDRPVQYQKWIKEGLVLPISDYAESYPNIQKLLQNFDVLRNVSSGKHYGIPIINKSDGVAADADHNFFIRKDWLEALNLEVPKTIDDFYNVAKAFREGDPDGNGAADTYGYTSSSGGIWWNYPIFNAFDTTTDRWEKVDGKWQPEVLKDETADALAFLNRMYQEKILDPEFMLNTDDQKIEKFITGKVGIIFHSGNANFFNGQYYDKFKQAYPDKDPNSLFTWIGTLVGKTGKQRINGHANFWCMTSIRGDLPEEKRTKALELLDYLASEEGQHLMLYGIEGIHYEMDGDKIVPLMDQAEKEKDRVFLLKNLVSWNTDFLPEETPNRELIIEQLKSVSDYAVADPLAYLSVPQEELDPSINQQLSDFTTETFVNIIVKSQDVYADFEKFKADWLAKGGDKVIEAFNKQAELEGR